jgi:hypothetical protein
MAWTTPRTWVTNELVTAAMMNTHVRDNLKHYQDTRYVSIPLNSAYYDSTTMSGFLTSATINVAKDDGVGTTNLTTFPYQSIIFPDSGATGVAFNFHVPPDYGGSPVLKIKVYNAGNSILGDKFGVFVAYIGAIGEGIDLYDPIDKTIESNSGLIGTIAGIVDSGKVFPIPCAITLTNTGGLVASGSAGLYLVRTPAAENDTLGQDVGVFDIWFEYSVATA